MHFFICHTKNKIKLKDKYIVQKKERGRKEKGKKEEGKRERKERKRKEGEGKQADTVI